jgi:hypothetical protein
MRTRTLLRSTAAATAASSSGVLVKGEQEPPESVIAERSVTAPLMQPPSEPLEQAKWSLISPGGGSGDASAALLELGEDGKEEEEDNEREEGPTLRHHSVSFSALLSDRKVAGLAASASQQHHQHQQRQPRKTNQRRAKSKEWEDNAIFWAAFKTAMTDAGHRVPRSLRASDVFSFRNNEDFREANDNGQRLTRGGRPYELPFGWKRYAVNVLGKYDNGDNTWLRCDGTPAPAQHTSSSSSSSSYTANTNTTTI